MFLVNAIYGLSFHFHSVLSIRCETSATQNQQQNVSAFSFQNDILVGFGLLQRAEVNLKS